MRIFQNYLTICVYKSNIDLVFSGRCALVDVVKFNLILKMCECDNKALEPIYDFYFTRIKLHIKNKYPDACADDVAQEFFLRLIKSHGFKYINNPTAWVYACCDNIAKSMLLGNAETVPLFAPENFELTQKYCVAEDFVDIEMQNDQTKRIFDALGDECTKKIFYLYYWCGYNLREISQLLSLNPGTVKQRHARAIKKVKNLL